MELSLKIAQRHGYQKQISGNNSGAGGLQIAEFTTEKKQNRRVHIPACFDKIIL
jgi:hypothetical protein